MPAVVFFHRFLNVCQEHQAELEKAKAAAEIPRIRELEHVGLLGCGAFAVVSLVGHHGRSYALKAISKGHIQSLRMEPGPF